LVTTDLPTDTAVEPLAVAKILQKIMATEQPNLVIMGKQAIDDDSNQTGQMLSALLNWPQGTYISKLSLEGDRAVITREIDGGLETLSLPLPAIVTTDLRLNTPRYAALPNIMKAKQKPLVTMTPDQLGIVITPRLSYLKMAEPAKRQGGHKVDSIDTLIDKLKNEAKVI
jgi:electron transfer flavoprotein beta subunit